MRLQRAVRLPPRDEKIKKLFVQLRALGVEVQSQTHQTIQHAERRVKTKVDDSGIILE